MRAKPVKSTAHIFDFDDTLITSDVKTHLYRNGKFVKSLSAADYNVYKKQPGDVLDMSDFENPVIIMNSKKHIMWPLLEEYDRKNDSELYILTARHEAARIHIHTFLVTNGIKNLQLENILCVGDNQGKIDIPVEKKIVLEVLAKQHSFSNYYDDNLDTIEFVKYIPNLNAYLVE